MTAPSTIEVAIFQLLSLSTLSSSFSLPMLLLPSLPTFLSLLAGLLFLVVLVLTLHRLSPQLGLLPMMVVLGGLTAFMQAQTIGIFRLSSATTFVEINASSFVILPVILLGLLVVYVANGSVQARSLLTGLILIGFLATLILIIHMISSAGGISASIELLLFHSLQPRIALAGTLTLAADLVILILTYQFVSNLRKRYPSRLAGQVALFVTLIVDALLFSLLAFAPAPGWNQNLTIHIAGKIVAGLFISPFIFFFLNRVTTIFPNSTATVPRPAFDLFMHSQQWEARALYHHGLLRTLSQINQLILRTNAPNHLLEQACQMLVAGRNHPAAWVMLPTQDGSQLHLATSAGLSILDDASAVSVLIQESPATQAWHSSQAVLISDVERSKRFPAWREHALTLGLRSAAIFPMRHEGHVSGVLGICSYQKHAFIDQEIDLFQELADDLAYALASLEARHRQWILQSAADTLSDGLLITDLSGKILYANQILAQVMKRRPEELIHHNLMEFRAVNALEESLAPKVQALLNEGKTTLEFETKTDDGRSIFLSVRAAIASDPLDGSEFAVSSIRDLTERHENERRLLELNRINSQLVDLHDPDRLLDDILRSVDKLLDTDRCAIFTIAHRPIRIMHLQTHALPDEWRADLQSSLESLLNKNAYALSQPSVRQPDEHLMWLQDVFSGLATAHRPAPLTLPLYYGDKVIGFLLLFYEDQRIADPEFIQLGRLISQTLAGALQNAHLYQAEQQQRLLAEGLIGASNALNSSLQLEEVLDLILEEIARVVSCRSVNIMLISTEWAQVVRYLDRRHDDPSARRSQTGVRLPLSNPILQKMLEDGQPLLIADTLNDPKWTEITVTHPVRSFAATPLQVRGEVIGFVNIYSDRMGHFGEHTTRWLQAFAATAATAIQNARLYQDLQNYSLTLEDRVRLRTAELSAEKERTELILRSVPDAVIVLDANGRPFQTNPAGEELILAALTAGIDLFNPAFLALIRDNQASSTKNILEFNDCAFQALGSPLTSNDSPPSGMVVVYRNVTHFRELDRMKTQLLSDVSHELRTPVTNQLIYLELLAGVQSPEKMHSYLNTLHRETERLARLIEDLLALSRLEAGRVEMQIQAVNANQLIGELVHDRRSMASARQIVLESLLHTEIPLAQADPYLLTQVLSNLLTNALNYTPDGGQIAIGTIQKQLASQSWIVVSVKDSGVGISPEELPHIFERFYRGEASRITGAHGTGLGLPISKEIITRMGGKIDVQSQPGQGSTFTVWLKAVL